MVINKNNKQYSVGVVTFPVSKAGAVALSNLINILSVVFNKVYVVTGNEGDIFLEKKNGKLFSINIIHKLGANLFTRIIRFSWTTLKISFYLIRFAQNVDLWVFFIGGEHLLVPSLIAKLSRRKVAFALAGTAVKKDMVRKDSFIVLQILDVIENLNFALADKIIIAADSALTKRDLKKMEGKIIKAHEHFIDVKKFRLEKPMIQRKNLVGYVGRLSEEKGILDFLQAIPKILRIRDDIEFFIGGDGPLRNKVEQFLDDHNLNNKVNFTGWIFHDDLYKYLNELKMLVVPSYTETGPQIAFEAMASGVLVLGTPVGLMSEIIKDGETGFIIESNSAESIAKTVIRAITCPSLEKIAENGHSLVIEELTIENAVDNYLKLLSIF